MPRRKKTEIPTGELIEADPDLIPPENIAGPGAKRLRDEVREHHSTGPRLTGGDLDADWENAKDVGDEAVGGHAATPDQDEVDEIGRALGVEQDEDEEVFAHEEIMARRDGRRWELDRRSADDESNESNE